jgi:hypothetical protein
MADQFEDGIDMAEETHVHWVQSQRDPDLWHQAAQAALAYRDDSHNFLLWLVQQAEMDRATAGWIFLWAEGSRYLRGETKFHLNTLSDDSMLELFRALCQRSEGRGFSEERLGLDADFEAERLKCVELVAKGDIAAAMVVPHACIDRPFAPPQRSCYSLDDGIIFLP